MNQLNSRFFIALLPPPEIQDYVHQIQQYCAEKYASRGALKSPPHITLQPPFELPVEQVPLLAACLHVFTQPVPVKLNGFGAFTPRVIYINVLKTPELLTLQADLMAELEAKLKIVDPMAKSRAFCPHMTVAFRDLTRQNFKAAWLEFQHRQLQFEFTANQLTLLIHDGKRWQVSAVFPLHN